MTWQNDDFNSVEDLNKMLFPGCTTSYFY